MNESRLFFRLLTAEESCIVSGGSMSNMPYFALTPTEHPEGRIMNADGSGKSVSIYGSQTSDRKTNNTASPYEDLGLPSVLNPNHQTM